MCPCLQPIKEGTGSWRRKHLSSDGWLATKLLIVGCNLSPAPECVKYFTFRKTFSRLPGEAFLQSTPGFGERRRNVLPLLGVASSLAVPLPSESGDGVYRALVVRT